MEQKSIFKKRYYASAEALEKENPTSLRHDVEFPSDPFLTGVDIEQSSSTSRRDFLKALGFSIGGAATLAACSSPVKYALPYVDKPAEITPGVANWYASTFFDGQDYASILVKTREGRPIKIEGNPLSTVTKSGVSARGQAHVLGLYDNNRLKNPVANKNSLTGTGKELWSKIDAAIRSQLEQISANKGNIRILTGTLISPSTKAIITEFAKKYPDTKHITYDAVSYSGLIEATERLTSRKTLPKYNFDKANVIVSLGADFLGTWLSPVEFTKQFSSRRKFDESPANMSRLYQFEANLSLTGANADVRIPVKASHIGFHALKLYNEVASRLGKPTLPSGPEIATAGNMITTAANDLVAAGGNSLVVCGSNDPNIQIIVLGINQLLGAIGNTCDLATPCNLRQGVDADFKALIEEMKSGQVKAILIADCNPAFTYGDGRIFAEALKNVPLKVSFATSKDETAALCDFVLPDNHPLESWNDHEPYRGHYSIQQPTINPLFNTRQFASSLLSLIGSDVDYHKYLQNFWRETIFKSKENKDFHEAWKTLLHDGVWVETKGENGKIELKDNFADAAGKIAALPNVPVDKWELVIYEKIGIGDGKLAHIPWLQEFPDPITRVSWDNYVCVPLQYAKEKGIKNGTKVKISTNKYSLVLPCYVLPGLQARTCAIALGYGRKEAGPAALNSGQNSYPFVVVEGANTTYFSEILSLEPTSEVQKLAQVQIHNTLMGRPIAKETTRDTYQKFIKEHLEERKAIKHHLVNLYPTQGKPGDLVKDMPPNPGHRWAMAIDLNLCTGCGACMVSCQAENNIPVVGKDEVMRGRDMHWIRIDRYFSDNTPEVKDAEESPNLDPAKIEVIFQPMLCQHCNNAPCENVCPVLATVHSSEGLNQQAYNRCFGTRYCANNCPYKVRRFNWFNYAYDKAEDKFTYNPVDELGRMVLNPDVTVRARGVMEKCSFCVQRLQYAKLEAKKAGKRPEDKDLQTACSQSCPANAIIFGDIADPNSAVSKIFHADRSFMALEDIKTYPSISYLTKVRNKPETKNS